MAPERHPPPFSRRLLAWAAKQLETAELAEDAGELFEEKAARVGERAARRWYRRQALAAVTRVVVAGTRGFHNTPAGTFQAPESHGEPAKHQTKRRFFRSMSSGISWLDVKLAVRMLSRTPGLTLVALFALSIGIPVGLLPLHVVHSLTATLPVEDGDEIVIVRNFDRAESDAVRATLREYERWREELSSFEQLGMWREDLHNVEWRDGGWAPVRGADVSASVFSLLRVPPLLGRPLSEADEVVGAPDVVVIGYDVWQSRAGGDPDIIGRTIRIGGVPHNVVGVMPEGFLFPYRDHLWLPLRKDPRVHAGDEGPSVWVMGRLANGVSQEQARRQLEVVGRRMAVQFPDTHEHLQPQVVPYTRALTGMDTLDARVGVLASQVLAFLLLALACGNVGVLVLARVANRTGELAIRTALGASRRRILSQLFLESLVLAGGAAGVGLIVLQAVAAGPEYLTAGLPFWVDFDVSLRTAAMAIALAIVSAGIAGVVPAVKATGKRVQASIQHASGARSGVHFGKGYTALIVGEVAAAFWLLAVGASLLPSAASRPVDIGIDADQYLYAALRIPGADETTNIHATQRSEAATRVAAAHRELIRRLGREPGVGPVAIASSLPGMSHASGYVQVEGVPRAADAPAPAFPLNVARVDVGYFDALDRPVLSGRGFNAGDLGDNRSAVIVNQDFVDRVLGGRNPIGRRLRIWTAGREPGPWSLEIVGVVGSLGANSLNPHADQALYQVAAPGELHPVSFAVRIGRDPERFIPRLRAIVTGIDAGALIESPSALDRVPNPERRVVRMSTYLFVLLAAIAVVLSAACLYALVSFTVARRMRECGIRAALGAQPANIVAAIAKRAFLQLSAGVLIGASLSAATLSGSRFETAVLRTTNWPLTIAAIALFILAVGMLACLKPTLTAIRIRPMEALEG